MVKKIREVTPPRGLARLAWRAPIWLYRLGMGGLLGERFLLLNHIGRKSGKMRQAVVEVVNKNNETGTFVVASGFGEQADWYKNLMVHPQVTIQVGQKRLNACAERLPAPQAAEALLDYHQRHPTALRTLAKVLGYQTDGSQEDIQFLAKVIPMILLTCRQSCAVKL